MDRLGKLNDPSRRKPCEHRLAEPLVRGPEVADVPATVEQDWIVRAETRQVRRYESQEIGAISDRYASTGKVGQLAEPDGQVADILVIGVVEERNAAVTRNHRVEGRVQGLLQFERPSRYGSHSRNSPPRFRRSPRSVADR